MHQRLLILGGTGFVGQHLIPQLVTAGYEVLLPTRQAHAIGDLRVLPGARVVSADIHDPATLEGLCADVDAVINLVGILNERGRNGAGFERAHVELTAKALAAAETAGIKRFLQMSALNAGRGDSHYLRTRGAAEALVRKAGAAGVWTTIYQPSVIFGPGDGLFCRFASLLRIAPLLPLARPGARFAPVYVGDVVQAILRSLDDPRSRGQSYQLGGPRIVTLREIVALTAETLGIRRLILPLPDWAGRLQAAVFDFVPGKPFSTDNYKSLLLDSVPTEDGLAELGIRARSMELILPGYLSGSHRQRELDRYRRAIPRA